MFNPRAEYWLVPLLRNGEVIERPIRQETLTDLNPGLPRELARVVDRCLAKDRERRYQSAKDLRNTYRRARTSGSTASERTAHDEQADGRRPGPLQNLSGDAQQEWFADGSRKS